MHTTQQFIKKLASRKDGAVAVTFALTFVGMAGFTGLAVDLGRAFAAQKRLQSATDQGAIAGASLPATAAANRIVQAETIFKANLMKAGMGNIPVQVNASNSGVTVSAVYPVSTSVLRMLRIETISVGASTTARPHIHNGGVACLISLNPTAEDGLHLQGINKLASENCWAWVNSTHPNAINAVGASAGRAQGFCTAGGVAGAEHFLPHPYTQCDTIDDPFENKRAPIAAGCNHTNRQLSNGTHTLLPGVYCGGLEIKPQANATFQPGVYVIRDGKLRIQAGSTSQGDGVVFVFEGAEAELIILGGANASFRAPSAQASNVGDLNGFVFFQDRSSTQPGRTTVIQGGGRVKLEGVVYMPTWRVDIGGNGEVNQDAHYFAMVADSFYMEGNGRLYVKSDAAAAGLPDLMPRIKNGPVMLE